MRCLSLLYPRTNERIERCILEVPLWLSAPRLIKITRTKRLYPRSQAGLIKLERVAHATAAPRHVTRCLWEVAVRLQAGGCCSEVWLESLLHREPATGQAAVHRGPRP